MYKDLSTSNTLLQIFVKTCIIYNNSPVDMSSQTFLWIQNSNKNSRPIVLIEILTIILKEGRSERGYNPETPSNFWNNPKDSTIEWHTHLS